MSRYAVSRLKQIVDYSVGGIARHDNLRRGEGGDEQSTSKYTD